MSPSAYYPSLIVSVVVFIATWIHCIATYGFLFGVGLGWIPAVIVATLAAFVWILVLPIVLFALTERPL